ncbi:MAG: type II/IV secretion system ATPase subunit [Candidatus Aenigmatarchaeota archaeon]
MHALKETVRKLRLGYLLLNAPKPVFQPVIEQRFIQTVSEQFPVQIQPQVITPIIYPQPARQEAKVEKIPSEEVGYDIPIFSESSFKLSNVAARAENIPIKLAYSLIPTKPEKGEKILASAQIEWDNKKNKYIYTLIEPPVDDRVKSAILKIKELIEQRLDIDFSKLKKFEAVDYLHKNINELLSYYSFKLSDDEKAAVNYYIERDFVGLGKIEPFMKDPNIEDISCDGTGIPIFIFHRNPKIGSLETNVVFNDADELDSNIMRLCQLSGKSISVATPLIDGSLPDGSRIQATLATDIARRGSNFTIRKFTEEPLTPVHLLAFGTVDVPTLAYLWMAVDFGRSILVSGGTASGKTTFLNVLSLFINPDNKVVSIEDTPELKLPHPHWVPQVARTALTVEGEKKIGEVDLYDLLKETMRQRPDNIIVGEVRGKEAFVLFQEMATGHASLSTIHAENPAKLIDRLTTAPISLPMSLLGSLDIVVFLLSVKYKDMNVRRVNEIFEITGMDPKTQKPQTNRIFKWNPITDKFEISGKSMVMKKISDMTGMKEEEVLNELRRRMLVLNWLKEKNISNYKDVFAVFNMYYTYPDRIISIISGERYWGSTPV